jgi:hypothetical protein
VSRIGIGPRVALAVTLVVAAALAVGAVGVTAAPNGPKTPHPKGVKVSRGATTLTVDPAFGTALGSEATTEILAPAEAKGIGVIDFPITQGRLLVTKNQQGAITAVTGSIWHVGGISLTDNADPTKTSRLRNARIVLDADPHMSAAVKTNDGSTARVEVFDLAFDPANVSITGEKKRQLTIEDIEVKLNGESAAALNALFGTAAFSDGQLVGTADVHTKIVGRR